MKTKQDTRTPAEVSAYTWILSCTCGQEIKRNLVPGWPKHNRQMRRDLADFQSKHSAGRYCKVTVKQRGIMDL